MVFLKQQQGSVISLLRGKMKPERILNTALILFLLWFFSRLLAPPGVDATRAIRFGNETDHRSLLAFKGRITRDPARLLSSWNDSVHFCGWSGVTCSRRHQQRVSALDLSSWGLEGSLSPSMGNLTFLRRLALDDNGFFGEIPSELGRLRRLKHLNLSFNPFHGGLPSNLTYCSELRILDLASNKLTGNIPAGIGSLAKLYSLNLKNNQLTGAIPPSIGNLSSLVELFLSYNPLTGSIPEDIGHLTTLESFRVSVSNITGTIPSNFYNISSLQDFSVSYNNLQGRISSDIGITLPNLWRLALGRNQFDGPIPATLVNASGLEVFDISTNHFSGRIPSEVGKLAVVHLFNVEINHLEAGDAKGWKFLDSLTNCSNLKVLSLYDNLLGGMLPNSFVNLSSQLQVLLFGENRYISGRIPREIGNLANLYSLSFGNNLLTGTIPETIGKLTGLQKLGLSINRFNGQIPFSLSNLTLLTGLFLSDNNLQGPIPSGLGNLHYLTDLDFHNNHLSGTIPKEIVTPSSLSLSLDLSMNSLVGSLPPEVSALKSLGRLNISWNKLSGDIPSTLGDCEMLEYLYLNNNLFQGTIPQSLRNIRALQELDLSHNNLTGSIPTFLEDLVLLEYLNLSFNNLEGEVPMKGIFNNATQFSIGGNSRLCGGIPELHLPACQKRSLRKKKWPLLLKIVIPVASVIFCMILLFFFLILPRKQKSRMIALTASPLRDQFPKVSYIELVKATEEFSSTNLIGKGGYGTVYKGILGTPQRVVAVKVFNVQYQGVAKSFLAECEVLRRTRHRNLVKVLTCCSTIDLRGNDFKALIFEFIPNGSLEKWLHPELDGPHHSERLSLLQRINIAIDVADAIDYLHNNCQPSIIHCDLKPSNVLLDNKIVAYVGDFGLARFMFEEAINSFTNQSSSSRVRGSIGYIAPEYAAGSQVSTFGDVYSYGILLLEMLIGKRPIDDIFKDGLTLHKFVEIAFPDRIMAIVDPLMPLVEDEGKTQECLVSMVRIGLSCSKEFVRERMNMSDVATTMRAIRNAYLGNRVH